MNRRRVLLNVGLGVFVLGLGAAGLIALTSPRADPLADLPTTTVTRGSLEATVTASGNTESGRTAVLQFAGTGGTVREVYVTTGQQVSHGDELVRIDDTAAQQQLDTSLAQLASAEASLLTATQGRTADEQRADSAGVASAEQGLKNAKDGLDSARATLELVRSQQSELVATAEAAVDGPTVAIKQAQDRIAELRAQIEATDVAEIDTISALTAEIDQLTATITAEQLLLDQAGPALAQAKRTRDSAVLQAEQAVTSAAGARDTAQKSLEQQEAAVAVNQQGPKPGTIESAEAQVESAQLAVDAARVALDDTVLRAPFNGLISTVSAVVGQSSATTAGAGAGVAGLVTLVDADGLRVTASIAEADATSIELGQPATITLPASGVLMTGKVISVDVQSTVTNNVVQYLTAVSIDSPPDEVRVGQTASLSILTGSRDDVLFVPTSAIAVDGATRSVLKLTDGQVSEVEVTTGLVGTTGTEVLSGLDEGDVVVLSNNGEAPQAIGFGGGPGSTSESP